MQGRIFACREFSVSLSAFVQTSSFKFRLMSVFLAVAAGGTETSLLGFRVRLLLPLRRKISIAWKADLSQYFKKTIQRL